MPVVHDRAMPLKESRVGAAPALAILLITVWTVAAVAQNSKPATKSSVPATVMEALKTAAAKKLKDPYSAQWEGLSAVTRPNVRGEPAEVICGRVNAKNGFGAYAGSQPFVYIIKPNILMMVGTDDTIAAPAAVKTFCTGLI